MQRSLFLASALLLALVASSEAVVCDSFKQRSECENIVTDAGICGWDEAAGKCVVAQRLRYGMVGITSLSQTQNAGNKSAGTSGGRRELKAVDGTFEPCVDKPTPEGFTCAQQKAWKKCSEPWMIEGGFCRITCGVCTPGAPSTPGAPNVLVPDNLPAAQEVAAPAAEVDPGFCTLPPVTGPCRAAMPRWYFDAANRKCMPFIYGGCQGNANNFETFAQCDAAAAKACNVGPSTNAPTVTVRRMWQP